MNEMMNLVDMPDWMRERMTAQGVESGVNWIVAEGSKRIGQMNGYVLVPDWSIWKGVPYDLIEGITAPSRTETSNTTGLSYGEAGWVGFAPNDSEYDLGNFLSVDAVADMARDVARQFASAQPSEADVSRITGWVKWEREFGGGVFDERAAFYAGFNAGRTIRAGE